MEGRRAIACVLALAGALGACSSVPPPSQPPGSVSPVPDGTALVVPGDCRARIEATNFDVAASIPPLDDCRFTDAGVEAARAVLAAGGTRDQLWAAVWIYGSTSGDPEPLRPLLTNDDRSLRAMSAAAVARAGERDGLASLRDALNEDGFLLGATPPLLIARFAATSLARLVAAPGTPLIIVSADGQARFIADWRTWFDENGQALVYNPEAGEWHLP